MKIKPGLTLFILLLFGTIVASCGAKKKVPAKIKYMIAAMTSAEALSGGGMLYGVESAGFKFAQPVPPGSSYFERDVEEGNWEFYMVAWQGIAPMQGVLRCGATSSSVSISGASAEVSLTLSEAGCDSRFIDSSIVGDVNAPVYPLRIVGCSRLTGVDANAGNTRCEDPANKLGASKAFKVVLNSYEGGAVFPGLQSPCISSHRFPNHKKLDSSHLTDLILPIGGTSGLFHAEIIGFEDKNCTYRGRSYEFRNGIGYPSDLTNVPETGTRLSNSGVHYKLGAAANPHATPSYTGQVSNKIYYDIKYFGTGTCNCSGLSPDDQNLLCSGGACPNGGNSTDTGLFDSPNLVNPSTISCTGDYSNASGPNCDTGTLTYKRIVCENLDPAVAAAGAVNCYYAPNFADKILSCGGTPEKCTNLNHVSLYLADNIFASGFPPLMDQAPDFSCSGAHCIPLGLGNGSGSGTYDLQKHQEVVSNFVGTFDGHNPWMSNGGGSGSGSGPYTEIKDLGTGSSAWFNWHFQPGESIGGNNDDHFENGRLGEIVNMMIGDGIGAFMSSRGIHTCANIPTSGSDSFSFFEEGITRYFDIQYLTGQEATPQEEWSAVAATYEKRIELIEGGIVKNVMEFNCTGGELKSGFYLDRWDGAGGPERSYSKIVYQADDSVTARADVITMHTDEIRDEMSKSVGRFQKTGVGTYRVYQSSVNRRAGSGSGSGSGPNWHAEHYYAEADTTKVMPQNFNTSRWGDISLDSKTYGASNGSVYIIGGNSSFNGWKVDWINSDINTLPAVTINVSTQVISVEANGIGPINPKHTVQQLYDAIATGITASGQSLEVYMDDLVDPASLLSSYNNQIDTLEGAQAANSIMNSEGRFLPDFQMNPSGMMYPVVGNKIEWTGTSTAAATGYAYLIGWMNGTPTYMMSSVTPPLVNNYLRYFGGVNEPATVSTVSTTFDRDCYSLSTHNVIAPINCFTATEISNDNASRNPVFDPLGEFNPNWLLNDVTESYFAP